MRQALIALTLAAVFIAIPAAAQPVVGLEIYREDDTFMSLVREAMERAAEGRASLEITFAENNQSIQNSGISRHLDLGVEWTRRLPDTYWKKPKPVGFPWSSSTMSPTPRTCHAKAGTTSAPAPSSRGSWRGS